MQRISGKTRRITGLDWWGPQHVRYMDDEQRLAKVEGLTNIRKEALRLAKEGADANEVRNYISEGKKTLAFEIPDEDAFKKAVNATKKYRSMRENE